MSLFLISLAALAVPIIGRMLAARGARCIMPDQIDIARREAREERR